LGIYLLWFPCFSHPWILLFVVVCGGAWVNMRKTIRPSFFYEKAQRAFDSLPFSSGRKMDYKNRREGFMF
jgi:hypothetical protein